MPLPWWTSQSGEEQEEEEEEEEECRLRRVSAGGAGPQPVGAKQERVLPRGERRAKDPERARPAQHLAACPISTG